MRARLLRRRSAVLSAEAAESSDFGAGSAVSVIVGSPPPTWRLS